MSRRLSMLLAAVLGIGASGAQAQALPDPAALLASAQQTGGLIQQYRDILRNPDANVRLAAFIQLARVDDPVVRQMAYDEGFASSDALLRNMALRYSFFDRSHFIITYADGATQAETYRIPESDLTTGEFRFANGYPGRVQGSKVQLTYGECVYDFALDDEDLLVGEETCRGERKPVTIDLRGN